MSVWANWHARTRHDEKGLIMTVNQKAAVLATLEIRLDNLRCLLERETDPEWRVDLIESLGELAGHTPPSASLRLMTKEELYLLKYMNGLWHYRGRTYATLRPLCWRQGGL